MTRTLQRVALLTARALVMWVGKRVRTQAGRDQMGDSRLEIEFALDIFFHRPGDKIYHRRSVAPLPFRRRA